MIKTIGPDSATFTMYLPNPPSEIPPTMELAQPDIALLTELNGNHWRKIFTILAKLAAPDNNWREYRDQHLLQNAEQISFGDTLKEQRGWHLIAGKASWQRLGFTDDMDRPHDMLPIDENGRIYIKGQIVLVPYPDYRQFPNQLIELLKERLESFT